MLSRRSKDTDTDPSTPDALRSVDTDPGLGPAGPATKRGMGEATAAAVKLTAKVSKKDSVEVLLDGMGNPQPERPRTTPQTAGQSSAAYHVEHSVRPARTSPDPEAKVVVERPPQNPTIRIDRSKLAAFSQPPPVSHARPVSGLNVLPMGVRIGLAVVAGLTVVLALFLMARSSGVSRASSTPSSRAHPPASAIAPKPTAPKPVTTATSAPASMTSEPPVRSVDSEMTSTAPALSSPASTAKPRARPVASPASNRGADLGEFKTTFH